MGHTGWCVPEPSQFLSYDCPGSKASLSTLTLDIRLEILIHLNKTIFAIYNPLFCKHNIVGATSCTNLFFQF